MRHRTLCATVLGAALGVAFVGPLGLGIATAQSPYPTPSPTPGPTPSPSPSPSPYPAPFDAGGYSFDASFGYDAGGFR